MKKTNRENTEFIELPSVLNMISVLLVAMVIRLFPIFMLGYYIIESTSMDEFVAAMEKWHDPELIAKCCNYFIFIEHGKIAWSGGWTNENKKRITDFFSFAI